MRGRLRTLVRLFPAPFREEFGDGMIDDLTRDYERARSRGPAATAWFTIATGWDLVRSAIAEHVSPTWAPPHARCLDRSRIIPVRGFR